MPAASKSVVYALALVGELAVGQVRGRRGEIVSGEIVKRAPAVVVGGAHVEGPQLEGFIDELVPQGSQSLVSVGCDQMS